MRRSFQILRGRAPRRERSGAWGKHAGGARRAGVGAGSPPGRSAARARTPCTHSQFAALRQTGPGIIMVAGGGAAARRRRAGRGAADRRGCRHGSGSAPRARSDCSECKHRAHEQQRGGPRSVVARPPSAFAHGHKIYFFLKKVFVTHTLLYY